MRDLHVCEGYATLGIVSLHYVSLVGFCQLVGLAGGLVNSGSLLLGISYISYKRTLFNFICILVVIKANKHSYFYLNYPY